MRFRRVAVAAVAVLLGASAPVGSTSDAVARLGWLSGDWVNEANGRWTEEQWSEPRGGLMLGLGRSGKSGRAMGFEFMRIAIDSDGDVVFWGSPGGSAAVPFKLVEASAAAVTFANPGHDFPKRISYRRSGETLVATVTGDDPASARSWTYRRRETVPVVAASGRKSTAQQRD